MKKICLLSIFMVSVLASLAQVDFKLQEGGYYAAPDGQDIIVVQFDGKNAHEIYTALLSNAQSLYNDFSKVGNTVDDTSITIRAISNMLLPGQKTKSMMGTVKFPTYGYYKLDFKIKDGRVKVSAPYIEDKIKIDDPIGSSCSFRDKVKKMFKNGAVKEKNQKEVLGMEYNINAIINAILYGKSTSSNNDDW